MNFKKSEAKLRGAIKLFNKLNDKLRVVKLTQEMNF